MAFNLRHLFRLCLLVILLFSVGWADTPTIEVILSTPVSSRINRVGNPVQAVLRESVIFKECQLPSGTTLHGQVDAVESSTVRRRAPGRIRVVFTDAFLPTGEVENVTWIPDTPNGWLTQVDGIIPAVKSMPGHSTRILNNIVRRRLPADRAVWNQALGINTNDIPDPSTDEFMQTYNKHDVLLGAGDFLRLRYFPYPVQYLPKD